MASLAVQAIDVRTSLPDGVTATSVPFADGAELTGVDLKSPRAKAGDLIDLTLYWRAPAL